MQRHIKKIISFIVCLMMIVGLSQDVEAASLKIRSFSINCGTTVTQGKKITLKTSASGGSGKKQYKFMYKLNGKTYTIKKYSSSKTASLKLTKTGTYTLYVYTKDKRKTIKKQKTIKVVAPYKVSLKTSGKYVNDTIQLSASSTGGKGTKQYKFTYKYNGKTYTIKNYSKTKKVSFKPKKTGKYQFIVQCKDSKKKVVSQSKTLNLQYPQLKVSLKATGKYLTSPIQLSASSTGGKGTKKYKYTYKYKGKTYTLKDYSTNKKIVFHLSNEGEYQFIVQCKDEQKKVATKSVKLRLQYPELKVSIHATGKYVHNPVQLKADATGGSGEKEYKFVYQYNKQKYTLKDFSKNQMISFEPENIGEYQFFVECRDSRKKSVLQSTKLIVERVPTLQVALDVSDQYVREKMNIKAEATGGEGDYQYCFVYRLNGEEILLQDYSEKGQVSLTPNKVGEYEFIVKCKDKEGIIVTSSITREIIVNPARTKVIEVAKSWLGCNEKDGSHKKIIDVYNHYKHSSETMNYKVKYTDAWCDTFVSACFIKAGYASISGTECGCQRHVDNVLKKKGAWQESDDYVPQTGDMIFYHGNTQKCDSTKDCKHNSHHVGLVVNVEGKNIKVIEGNYSDSVKYRTIQVGDARIRGYGVPKYPH